MRKTKGFTPLEKHQYFWRLSQAKNMRVFLTGFTLMELLVVVIVIGILVTAGIINYSKTLQNMRQREAVNLIDAIYGAEKSYGVETYGSVNACVSVADCNTKLRLALPLSTSCAYAAIDYGAGVFCVQADCGSSFKLSKRSATNSFVQGALCP